MVITGTAVIKLILSCMCVISRGSITYIKNLLNVYEDYRSKGCDSSNLVHIYRSFGETYSFSI